MKNICTICLSKESVRRTFCASCYGKGLKNGTILKLEKPPLPTSLTNAQHEILIGSLLGDGCLFKSKNSKYPILSILRSLKDKQYLEWEYSFFKDFCLSNFKDSSYFDIRTNKTYYTSKFVIRSVEVFNNYYNDWYYNGVKLIPKNLELTSLILTIWFCDDGSISKPGSDYRLYLKLATNGFSFNDVEYLKSLLESRFDEKFTINKSNNQPVLKGNDNATRAFLSEIDEYMPNSMLRKSNIWRDDKSRFYNNKPNRSVASLKNRENDLSNIEFNIMKIIEDNNKTSINDIINYIKIDKSNLHRYLKRLINNQLILCTKSPSYHDGYSFSILEKGIELILKMNNKL